MAYFLNIKGDDPNLYSKVIIDTVEYVVHTVWNTRSGWYLSFYDPLTFDIEKLDNSPSLILGGRKLMYNGEVFIGKGFNRLPTGDLRCVDTQPELAGEKGKIVGRDNFGRGKRFKLIYYTDAELISMGIR